MKILKTLAAMLLCVVTLTGCITMDPNVPMTPVQIAYDDFIYAEHTQALIDAAAIAAIVWAIEQDGDKARAALNADILQSGYTGGLPELVRIVSNDAYLTAKEIKGEDRRLSRELQQVIRRVRRILFYLYGDDVNDWIDSTLLDL